MQHTIESITEAARTGTVRGYFGQPVRGAVVTVGPMTIFAAYDHAARSVTWNVLTGQDAVMRDEAFVRRFLEEPWRMHPNT